MSEEAGCNQLRAGQAAVQIRKKDLSMEGANLRKIAEKDVGFFNQLRWNCMLLLIRINQLITITLKR